MPIADILADMQRLHRAPEPDIILPLCEAARVDAAARQRITARAGQLLDELRAAQSSGWVNRFLQEYRLNTDEGIALLALAEAFLRVPDAETADLLIRDKLGTADWSAHAGKSDSTLVNSATWGLVVTRSLVGESGSTLKRLIGRVGEPVVRTTVGTAMRLMGQVFVMGRTIEEALERANDKDHTGFVASFDMLGEAARTRDDAERYFRSYSDAIDAIGKGSKGRDHSISVKLSALHPRYETAHADTCVPELSAMLVELAGRAAKADIGLTVDAEESERLVMSLDIIAAAARAPSLSGWDKLGMAVQAYSKRCRAVIAWGDAIGGETNRKIAVRLVKGAYWDSEIKRTQEAGLSDYPLFTRKAATDVSYLACARDMLAAKHIYPAFASHNALTVATLLEWAGDRRDFEFQRLHGMGEGLHDRLVREGGYNCRIYAPVGGHRDLLAYLVRRLLENGANSSFVHQLADPNVTEEELLADPVEKIVSAKGTRHPSIPLPAALFGAVRGNSEGLDLQDAMTLEDTASAIAARADIGPAPADSTVAEVQTAIAAADAAFEGWSRAPVETRAAALNRLADLLEEHRIDLMALAVHEAGKTIGDAIGEVREAADFCRYYANQARAAFAPIELPGPTGESNTMRLEGRGVFACIAPWNFPLAIFLGQITAALVAGNSVVAKPAPQTPRIALRAVALAHEAGIPKDVLKLVVGGADVGNALTGDPRVMGVAFTGSTGTAKAIARSLVADDARPIVPLIAETGGLNAMIVDSTALPEQVIADVVTSAFRSAGQRCSALRLLVVQEDVLDRTLEMLKGAMDTLVVGDPADPRTDVGPVIDDAAYRKLEDYRLSVADRWLHTVAVPEGRFVAPTVIRLDCIEDMTKEWFGPILHVTTWKTGTLDETIARINRSGYGLTMGLHSRIASRCERTVAAARVGNLYVNRSMIGAIVGSQPFGGEGLSGTGPKAGGPHYLPRFAVERTVSIDTTSAGGNASLLSIEDVTL
ncbi:L-glutamate gamma-semialdehyde dehydrogenase [Sphingosinicella xenopeptidilytica]|uniref:Bifunctional protein PutA n=1 Tax=Sphingosinicella xenopeptidilytica TaxID=364098 RepID=A0ABW3C3P8_SPHXN